LRPRAALRWSLELDAVGDHLIFVGLAVVGVQDQALEGAGRRRPCPLGIGYRDAAVTPVLAPEAVGRRPWIGESGDSGRGK
jgi:hypothetical protein